MSLQKIDGHTFILNNKQIPGIKKTGYIKAKQF